MGTEQRDQRTLQARQRGQQSEGACERGSRDARGYRYTHPSKGWGYPCTRSPAHHQARRARDGPECIQTPGSTPPAYPVGRNRAVIGTYSVRVTKALHVPASCS